MGREHSATVSIDGEDISPASVDTSRLSNGIGFSDWYDDDASSTLGIQEAADNHEAVVLPAWGTADQVFTSQIAPSAPIQGWGDVTSRIKGESVGDDLIHITDSGVGLRHFRLLGRDGNGNNSTGIGCHIKNGKSHHFYDFYQRDCDQGLVVDADQASDTNIDKYFNQCVWESNTNEGIVVSDDVEGAVRRVQFQGGYSYGNGTGARIEDIARFWMDTMAISRNTTQALLLQGVEGGVFSNLQMRKNGTSLRLEDSASGTASSGNLFANCSFRDGIEVVDNARDNYFVGGRLSGDITFGDNANQNTTHIANMRNWNNYETGVASAAHGDTISTDLDDDIWRAHVTVAENTAAIAGVTGDLGGSSFALILHDTSGFTIGTNTDINYTAVGRTHPSV